MFVFVVLETSCGAMMPFVSSFHWILTMDILALSLLIRTNPSHILRGDPRDD